MNRIAPAAALLIASTAFGQAVIPGSFTRAQTDNDRFFGGQALEMRHDLRALVSAQDEIILTGVPVSGKQAFDLRLTRRDAFAEGAEIRLNQSESLPASTADIFAGSVEGVQDSIVVIALSDHFTYGYIEHQGGLWIFSTGQVAEEGMDQLMVFNADEAPEGMMQFGVHDCTVLEVPGQDNDDAVLASPKMDPPCRVVEVAIETDREFTRDLFGNNVAASTDYANLLVAANSEIYGRDLNTTFEITYLGLWTSNDPWTENGGTVDQLFQFRDTWESGAPTSGYHLAHFFSGRGLGGGVAWLGVVCNPDGFNYALSANLNGFFPYPLQDQSTENWDMMVTAHEWGHNFGAPHTHQQSPLPNIDNCGNGTCDNIPGTIMSYCHLCGNGTGDVNLEFHPQNVNSYMLPHLEFDAPCDTTSHPNCDTSCPGDLADTSGFGAPDGQVDFGDFFALSFLTGPCGGGTNPDCVGDLADTSGFGAPDGQINFGDFFAMSFLTGPCP